MPFYLKHTELFPMVNTMDALQLEAMFVEALSVVMSRIFPVFHILSISLT